MMDFTQIKSKLNENKNEIAIAIFMLLGILLVKKIVIDDLIPDCATFLGHADEEQFIYHLSDDDVIVQEFQSPHDFEFITLHFSDHEQRIPGKTYLSLTDVSTGDQLFYQEYENSSISYGELVEIAIPGGGKRDVPYSLTVSFEGMDDNGLGIFGYEADGSYLPSCSLSDQYAVAVGIHSHTNSFRIFTDILICFLCLMICWSFYVFTKENWKTEQRFLALAIPIGVFFLAFFHPNPVHDGLAHLNTSFFYANKPIHPPTGEMSALTMNEKMVFNSLTDDVVLELHIDHSMLNAWADYSENFKLFCKTREWTTYSIAFINYDSSIYEYLPAIVSIMISRILHFDAHLEILFMKISMFACYIFASYFAIRIAPYKKTLIAFSAILPMCLYQATGVTYDSIVMGVCLLLTAYFIRSKQVVLMWQECVVLGLLCFILGRNKGSVYMLIPIIFLLMPKRIGEESSRRFRIWISCAIGGLIGIWPTLWHVYISRFTALLTGTDSADATAYVDIASVGVSRGILENLIRYRLTDSEKIPLSYIVKTPVDTMKLIIRSFIEQAEGMLGQLIGNRMSWTDEKTNWCIIAGFVVLLLASAVQTQTVDDSSDETKGNSFFKINLRNKVVIWGLLLLETIAFYIVMMMTETRIFDPVITGVQGRYFLPWLALILMTFSSQRIKIDERGERLEFFLYGILLAVYGMSFLMIFIQS